MRVPLLGSTLLLAAAIALAGCSDDDDDNSNITTGNKTIYHNGIVLTLNEANDTASAVAVEDGRILSVGDDEALLAQADEATELVDLGGKTMIPGIYDAHSHFSATGTIALFNANLNSPPIGAIESIADIIVLLSDRAATLSDGEWIQGFGYDDTLLSDNRHPTRQDLDQVSTTHPILITHISGHLSVANSLALTMAGITADTPQPEGGVIRTDEDGEPTGVLEEPPASSQVSSLLPALTDDDIKAAINYAADLYASMGVTTANEGAASPKTVTLTDELASSDAGLPIRLMVWPVLETVDVIEAMTLTSDQISIGGVKEFADGSIQGYTGYLSEPYYVIPEDQDADYRGFPRHERAVLASRIKEIHDAGRQAIVHGNGDAAIDDILFGLRAAQEANPREDTRPIIIHSQMAREDQLDEMQELGVIPSFFSMHTYYWGDRHRDIFMGPERAANMSPARSAGARDILYTVHADTPVVPMEPMRMIWSTVNRISTSGAVIGENQTVSPLEALRATTINAAYENFEEDSKGSIEVGKLADLVVLSDNLLTVNPLTIKDIVVEKTILGGKVVYESAAD